ncbi:MAG: hypothetical protein ABL895_19415 [Cyclobacteriaceae bacterium]
MPTTKKTNLYIGGLLYVLLFAGSGSGLTDRDRDDKCRGSQRWSVKVAADEEAEEIQREPIIITLAELAAYDTDTLPNGNERKFSEKFIYTLEDVFITKAILENDNDIHLVIEDGSENTLIAEIPDVDCEITEDSKFVSQIRKSRNTFLRYQNTYQNYFFSITGVFFKDKPHGQTGKAPNDVELHPVIALRKVKKIIPD